MGKKMYYNEQEAAETLGISAEDLTRYIRDDKVRVFQDGPRKMFRVDEVEALADKGDSAEEEEIQLTPVEAAGGEEVELAPVEAVDGKEAMPTVADEQAAEPVTEQVAEPVTDEAAEPLTEQVAEPLTEQVDIVADQVDLIARQTEPVTEQIDALAQGKPPAADKEIAFEKTVSLDRAEPAPAEQGAEKETVPAAVDEMAFEKTVSLDRAGDELSLAEADVVVGKAKKEDTVITAEGISIFDEEDLEIEAADPMAKTQIAPSLEDQISIEGVGSGSGLLDLTRESDDTSLGAEVLDHIDETTDGAAELEPASVPEVEPYEPQPVAATEAAPTFVEPVDPGAGMFGGMIIGSAIVALFLGSVPLASARGAVPGYLEWYKENLLAVLIGAAVLVGVATLVGLFLGKAIAAKQQAMTET